MTTQQALEQDADLAVTDATLTLAGITEMAELSTSHALTANTATEIARDIVRHLDALRAWTTEQLLTALDNEAGR